jgi:hypothetical protein
VKGKVVLWTVCSASEQVKSVILERERGPGPCQAEYAIKTRMFQPRHFNVVVQNNHWSGINLILFMLDVYSRRVTNKAVSGFGMLVGAKLLFVHGVNFSFLQFFLFLQLAFTQVHFQKCLVEFGDVKIGQLSELVFVERKTFFQF